MTTKVSGQSIVMPLVNYTPATVDSLPGDIIFSIFNMLSFKDCLSSKLTCHKWKELIQSRYVQEIDAIKNLCQQVPRASDWEDMPLNWKGLTKFVKLTSCSGDIIAFHPQLPNQSTKFFSFSSPIPFSEDYIVLAQCDSTYFLTEIKGKQGSQVNKLITYNFKDPSKNRKILIADDSEIKYCFPLSESNIAVVTSDGRVSFWDLSNETPTCSNQAIQVAVRRGVYRLGDYLVSGYKIINLATQSARCDLQLYPFNHFYKFKTYGSGLCNILNPAVGYRSMSSSGNINRQWAIEYNHCKFMDLLDMNEKYILMMIDVEDNIGDFQILDSKNGNVILWIGTEQIGKDPIKWDSQPTFAQLSGNFFIYKHPQTHVFYFLHIPARKLWLLECNELIDDEACIQDVRFHDGKLTILLTHLDSTLSEKFSVIQYEAKIQPQEAFDNPKEGLKLFAKIHTYRYLIRSDLIRIHIMDFQFSK